jgi:hypothetical protein
MPLNHVMAASANGKVYAIGGQTTEPALRSERFVE